MSEKVASNGKGAGAVFAGRIDILYALGRHYLSLPFAALCIPVTLIAGKDPSVLTIVPLMLQIAVVIAADSFFVEQRERIAQLALKYRLPSIFSFREHVQAGGLISYGQHLADSYRRAATYVDRIFNGAKPSELPVELSTRLELIVNLKTAKALGVTVPDTVLARADEVIE